MRHRRQPAQPGATLHHHDRVARQVPQPLKAIVGRHHDQTEHIQRNAKGRAVTDHGHGVGLSQHVAQHGLQGIDRLPVRREHAQTQQPLARRLAIPDRFEQPAVKPGEYEPEHQEHAHSDAARTDGKEHGTRDEGPQQRGGADEQIDKKRRQTPKGAGQHILKGDVLGRDDRDARIELSRRFRHSAIIAAVKIPASDPATCQQGQERYSFTCE